MKFRIEEYFGSDTPYWQVVADFDSKPEAEEVLARVNTTPGLLEALKIARAMMPKYDAELADAPLYHKIDAAIQKAEGRS